MGPFGNGEPSHAPYRNCGHVVHLNLRRLARRVHDMQRAVPLDVFVIHSEPADDQENSNASDRQLPLPGGVGRALRTEQAGQRKPPLRQHRLGLLKGLFRLLHELPKRVVVLETGNLTQKYLGDLHRLGVPARLLEVSRE